MPTIPRNQLKIDRAKCIGGRRTIYRVEGIPGLELDVSPTGARNWRIRYQVGTGAMREGRRYTIGPASAINLGKATEKAHEVIAAVRLERRDPHADRARDDLSTFGALFGLWLERHSKKNKKSWAADETLYARHIKSRLAYRAIADLTKRDLVDVLDAIMAAASGSQANAAQAIITATLNWAENEGKIESHAARGIPKRHRTVSRDRVLSSDEMHRWWNSLDAQLTKPVARVLRLLLLTGVRLSEACGMAKSELSDDVWEVPGARTKSGRPHVIPITPVVARLIQEAFDDCATSSFVFPAFARRRMLDKPMTRHTPDHAYARIARTLGFVDKEDALNTGVHDLRRTAATNMARLGIAGELIDRVQGRVPRGNRVSETYNRHEYLNEKRDALLKWERELMRIVGIEVRSRFGT